MKPTVPPSPGKKLITPSGNPASLKSSANLIEIEGSFSEECLIPRNLFSQFLHLFLTDLETVCWDHKLLQYIHS